MTATRRTLSFAAAVLLGAALVAWLLRPSPVAVQTAPVTRGPLQVALEEEGETRVEPRYVVAAPVAGRLLRPQLREGDAVGRGQAVARLAPLPLDAPGRQQAEAALAAARAAFAEAEARSAEASAALQQARRTRERQEALGRAGHVAAEVVDQARTAERLAAQSLDAARHRAEAAACEVESARAALRPAVGDDPAREIALCAPADGRVLRVLERSERIVAAGTPLLELGDPGDLEVIVEVLSTDAVGLRPGTAMQLDFGDGLTVPGRLERVEPAAFTKVSPLGVEEQRVRAVGALLAAEPRVGDRYRVQARLVVWEAPDVLQAPTGAVFRHERGWAAFTVEQGRAHRRELTLGHRNPDRVEVLAGLAEGAQVVLYPPDRLRDGDRVEVSAP